MSVSRDMVVLKKKTNVVELTLTASRFRHVMEIGAVVTPEHMTPLSWNAVKTASSGLFNSQGVGMDS